MSVSTINNQQYFNTLKTYNNYIHSLNNYIIEGHRLENLPNSIEKPFQIIKNNANIDLQSAYISTIVASSNLSSLSSYLSR
jgi:hypothetical protein